jgi:hypothetical protein
MSGTVTLVLTLALDGRVAFDSPGYDDEIVGSDRWRSRSRLSRAAALSPRRSAVTWQGVIDQYARSIGQLPDRVATARFGQDRHAGFKRRFDPLFLIITSRSII